MRPSKAKTSIQQVLRKCWSQLRGVDSCGQGRKVREETVRMLRLPQGERGAPYPSGQQKGVPHGTCDCTPHGLQVRSGQGNVEEEGENHGAVPSPTACGTWVLRSHVVEIKPQGLGGQRLGQIISPVYAKERQTERNDMRWKE